MIQRLILASLFLLVVPFAHAEEFPGIDGFIDKMVSKHRFERDELARAFGKVQRRQAVLDAISRPATLKPWEEYRAAFINPQRISGGLKFWKHYAKTLRRAEKKYGVPQEIIVALIGVETRYGANTGRFGTLEALSTLAFAYPRRAAFFRGELEQYLLLAREQHFGLLKVQGSYAGALGVPQFMPSSYRQYAVDFNGDGKTDLLHEAVDAIGSVANYLKRYGWKRGGPITLLTGSKGSAMKGKHTIAEWEAGGIKADVSVPADAGARLMDFTVKGGKEYWLAFGNFDVITRYNNSDFYAMSVFQLAQALREAHH